MKQQHIEVLDHLASELTYLPTPEQRKAKSAFWTRFSDNPLCDPQDISLAMAARFVADGRISKWWSTPGFKEWFRNRDEFRQRMEYLAHLALDGLEQVLADPHEKGAAKVNAAKLIMEVARKMPPKQATEQFLDEKIAQMDRSQLEEYISRNIRLLNTISSPEKPLTTNTPDDTVAETEK